MGFESGNVGASGDPIKEKEPEVEKGAESSTTEKEPAGPSYDPEDLDIGAGRPESGESGAPAEKPETAASAEEASEKKEFYWEEKLGQIEKDLASTEESIAELTKVLDKRKGELKEAREALGLPPLDDEKMEKELKGSEADFQRLDELLGRRDYLEGEKEKAVTAEELNDILGNMVKLDKNELKIIIETGKTSSGGPLKTKDGREINPDVAKRLGELAFKGVKKITEATLLILLEIVKGIIAGIFAAAAAASGKESADEASQSN